MMWGKATFIVLFATTMGALVIAHTKGVNGIAFHRWTWQRLDPVMVCIPFAIAIVPALVAQFIPLTRAIGRAAALLLLMTSCAAMKQATIPGNAHALGKPFWDLSSIWRIVESPGTTSYYTDAAAHRNMPIRELLRSYPAAMRSLNLHTKTKPPGPMLYWWSLIKLLGENHRSALVGAFVLGAITLLAIPATYRLLVQLLDGDREAAFAGASILAGCPGFVLFFPMFDPAYILISTAMIGLWHAALKYDELRFAFLLGLVLAFVSFMTFNVAVLGAFMLGLIFITPLARQGLSERLQLAGKHAIIVLAVWMMVAFIGMMNGYDPIETFASAWRNQQELKSTWMYRPLPYTIPLDLLDFALGSGWISVPLVLFYLAGPRRYLPLTILALGQLVLVAVLGLLQLETARVWCFMLPLLMIPIGLELRVWPAKARVACLLSLCIVTATIYQNLTLMNAASTERIE